MRHAPRWVAGLQGILRPEPASDEAGHGAQQHPAEYAASEAREHNRPRCPVRVRQRSAEEIRGKWRTSPASLSTRGPGRRAGRTAGRRTATAPCRLSSRPRQAIAIVAPVHSPAGSCGSRPRSTRHCRYASAPPSWPDTNGTAYDVPRPTPIPSRLPWPVTTTPREIRGGCCEFSRDRRIHQRGRLDMASSQLLQPEAIP
jgi:hypothetical protein